MKETIPRHKEIDERLTKAISKRKLIQELLEEMLFYPIG